MTQTAIEIFTAKWAINKKHSVKSPLLKFKVERTQYFLFNDIVCEYLEAVAFRLIQMIYIFACERNNFAIWIKLNTK